MRTGRRFSRQTGCPGYYGTTESTPVLRLPPNCPLAKSLRNSAVALGPGCKTKKEIPAPTLEDQCERFLELADKLVDERDCKLRNYDASSADAKKYHHAVLGNKPETDANGEKTSFVGKAVVTEDPDLWKPRCGFRVVRPMTHIPTGGSGSKMRKRFCFNSEERERRRIDHAAKR